MEAIIQNINIYDNGLVEMVVICNHCKHINYHTITHSSIKKNDKLTIDFSKLGKRCCANFTNPNSVCHSNYNLYK